MANIIPGVPPVYDGTDLKGTVKKLCDYFRIFQERVDFVLANNECTETFEEIDAKIEEQEIKIKALQDRMEMLDGE